MSTAKTLITAEEFMQMSFDHPVELVRGEIVHMPPPKRPHGGIAAIISFSILSWTNRGELGRVASNDSVVRTGHDPDTLRGADVSYFCRAKVERGALTPDGEGIPPDLCVEVLSPSNSWSEVKQKIDEFLECGVTEVWIADPELESVEIRRLDKPPRTIRHGETLTSDLLPGFESAVDDFFDLT